MILCEIGKIFIFRPKWPSFVFSVTTSLRTSSVGFLVFQIEICDLMQTIDVKFSYFVQNGIRVHPPSCITPWWHSDLIPKKTDFLPIFYSYLLSSAKIVVLKISVFKCHSTFPLFRLAGLRAPLRFQVVCMCVWLMMPCVICRNQQTNK